MCLSCGCDEPNNRHGDDRHIIEDDIVAAAKAADMTPKKVAQNILDGLDKGKSKSKSS